MHWPHVGPCIVSIREWHIKRAFPSPQHDAPGSSFSKQLFQSHVQYHEDVRFCDLRSRRWYFRHIPHSDVILSPLDTSWTGSPMPLSYFSVHTQNRTLLALARNTRVELQQCEMTFFLSHARYKRVQHGTTAVDRMCTVTAKVVLYNEVCGNCTVSVNGGVLLCYVIKQPDSTRLLRRTETRSANSRSNVLPTVSTSAKLLDQPAPDWRTTHDTRTAEVPLGHTSNISPGVLLQAPSLFASFFITSNNRQTPRPFRNPQPHGARAKERGRHQMRRLRPQDAPSPTPQRRQTHVRRLRRRDRPPPIRRGLVPGEPGTEQLRLARVRRPADVATRCRRRNAFMSERPDVPERIILQHGRCGRKAPSVIQRPATSIEEFLHSSTHRDAPGRPNPCNNFDKSAQAVSSLVLATR